MIKGGRWFSMVSVNLFKFIYYKLIFWFKHRQILLNIFFNEKLIIIIVFNSDMIWSEMYYFIFFLFIKGVRDHYCVFFSLSISPLNLPPIHIISSCVKVFWYEDPLNPSLNLVDDWVHVYHLLIWVIQVLWRLTSVLEWFHSFGFQSYQRLKHES